MKTPATNFEALLGQARDCGLTQEFATAYEINVALDEADCCGGGGGGGVPEQSKSTTYTDNGRYTVNPDEGYTLSAVNITVNVDQNLTVISELQLEVAQLEGEIATITSLNISENGTFTPPAGILGYNSIDVNVAGGGGSVEGDFGYISNLSIYIPNNEPLPELYYLLCNNVSTFYIRGNVNSILFKEGNLTLVYNMDGAFSDCSSLTDITFPEGALTKIRYINNMFAGCSKLTSITFPEGALMLTTSAVFTFYRCSSLTSVIFPKGFLALVKGLPNAFASCGKLTSIIFTEGDLTLVNMMYATFNNCTALTSITFPEGALTLATSLNLIFSRCSALQDLTIYNLPNINLTDIGFTYCKLLTLSSLQNIVNALPTTTSGYKCTLGADNLAKLSDTDIQIATDKGWTLN